MFDLRGADAESKGAKSPVCRGVGVAADKRAPGQRKSLLRTDNL